MSAIVSTHEIFNCRKCFNSIEYQDAHTSSVRWKNSMCICKNCHTETETKRKLSMRVEKFGLRSYVFCENCESFTYKLRHVKNDQYYCRHCKSKRVRQATIEDMGDMNEKRK